MPSIEPGTLVILYCTNPREKLWGELRRLDTAGVELRGLELYYVEEWMKQRRDGGGYLAPSTLFIPMHRVERIYADESTAAAVSFADRYAAMCGGDIRRELERAVVPSPGFQEPRAKRETSDHVDSDGQDVPAEGE